VIRLKKNKRIIPVIAVIGAFAMLFAMASAAQSNDSDAAAHTLTINIKAGLGVAEYSTDGGLTFSTYTIAAVINDGDVLVVQPKASTGYDFDKWVTPAVETTAVLNLGTVSGPFVLDLYFKPKQIEITFMGAGVDWKITPVSGGDPVQSGNKLTCNYGSKFKAEPQIKEGYEGTPTIKIGTTDYIAGTEYTVTTPVTFTVSGMSLKSYTVTFAKTDGVTWKVGSETLESGTKTFPHGTKIKVDTVLMEKYEGTPAIKAGGAAYTANTDYEVKSDVTFTVSGVSAPSNGGSIVLYLAIGAAALLVVGAVLWMFWFRKP